MVVLSKSSVDEVHRLLAEQEIVIQPDRIRDIIAGIRLRLQDIAKGLTVEETIAATIHVLKDAYAEIKLRSSGTGLDQEQLGDLLWDVLEASAGSTKAYAKLAQVTTTEDTWQDMCARLFAEVQVDDDQPAGPILLLPPLGVINILAWSGLGLALLFGITVAASGRIRLQLFGASVAIFLHLFLRARGPQVPKQVMHLLARKETAKPALRARFRPTLVEDVASVESASSSLEERERYAEAET